MRGGGKVQGDFWAFCPHPGTEGAGARRRESCKEVETENTLWGVIIRMSSICIYFTTHQSPACLERKPLPTREHSDMGGKAPISA